MYENIKSNYLCWLHFKKSLIVNTGIITRREIYQLHYRVPVTSFVNCVNLHPWVNLATESIKLLFAFIQTRTVKPTRHSPSFAKPTTATLTTRRRTTSGTTSTTSTTTTTSSKKRAPTRRRKAWWLSSQCNFSSL